MSSSSPLARPNGRADSHRASLPTFEPIRSPPEERTSRAESSASDSQQSGSGTASNEQINLRDSLSSFRGSFQDESESPETSHNSRWKRNRSSGGFLLDPISRPARMSRTSIPRPDKDPKGKRRSQESELSVPKRKIRDNHVRPASGIGGSPLVTEVKPETIVHNSRENGNIVSGTDIRHSTTPHLEITQSPMLNVGYDTDPAQIVNMALSLSEGRRRQASAKRYFSGDQVGRRVTSSATTNSNRTTSISQYLTPRKQTSQTGSPKPRLSTPQSKHLVEELPASEINVEETDSDNEALFGDDVSRATQARVQKAKTYFELAYQHRRLLSHLPPIRRPGAQLRPAPSEGQSKVYNPLQYIRNRKLRVWDKTAIDAEAEGWHDVEKVRNWIDIVVHGHQETRHNPDECVRLPPISQPSSHVEESDPDAPKQPPVPRAVDQPPPKPRRPRSDWVTHPGDMIADCFWLEQGMNKIKIQDRDNIPIYPPDTHFKFSGWRNRATVALPHTLQGSISAAEEPKESVENEQPVHSPLPELPTFRSAQQSISGGTRTRKRDKIRASIAHLDEERGRRKGLKIFMDDSDSSRQSESSRGDNQRGRKLVSRKRQKTVDTQSSDHLTTLPTQDSLMSNTVSPYDISQPSSAQNSKRTSIDHSHFGRLLKRGSTKSASPLTRSQNRAESIRQESIRHFPPFEDAPRSSAEYDSTAPNSPLTSRWPSIAINLESPPQSRSPSPSKKHMPSVLYHFRDRVHHIQDKISSADFANVPSGPSSKHASSDTEKKEEDSSNPVSRGTSPMTRGLSPTARSASPLSKNRAQSTHSDLASLPPDHRASTVSRVSTRTSGSGDHSRIRGMFKGGRIAEIVGNEVSRVGDFIWKRDLPTSAKPRGSISDGSVRSYYSDTDEEPHINGNVFKTPPPQPPALRRSRSSTISSTISDKLSPTFSRPSSSDRPKYNNPNLPSFISPFQQDKERQEKIQGLLTPTNSPPQDHISKMAAQHRSASRSPRLDKLAPPKLTTSQPGSGTGLTRSTSYGFASGFDLTQPRDASAKLNSAISNQNSPALATLKGSKSAVELSRMLNTPKTDGQQGVGEIEVSKMDITRAEALILSSAIKAREIGRRADAPRHMAPKFLAQTINPSIETLHTVELSQVRRREEHVVAARNIMSTLSHQASMFNDQLRQFSGTKAPSLHTELQTLEDMVEKQMTPRVRIAVDDAGELIGKLTTTSTMAVKDLNDTIEDAMRRRRRGPVRWIRRLWYASIEWAVVGLLWAIWAVVTVLRLGFGTVHCVVQTMRWMLWLD